MLFITTANVDVRQTNGDIQKTKKMTAVDSIRKFIKNFSILYVVLMTCWL
jgi:hypothetical protein